MKVGIIGAGASGMMAAITAAEYGAEVVLIEKNDRVGKKILATGNGKCNIGNLDFGTEHYYCEDKQKLEDIFSAFSVKDSINFFENNGMMVRDKNGYLYPYSEQASTVLDTFRRLLKKPNIKVILETEVKDAYYHDNKKKFQINCGGETYFFDKLVIACGGPASLKNGNGMLGFKMAEAFGHSVRGLVPGLVQLRSDEKFLKITAGVRARAEVTLYIQGKKCARELGELQFTDYGISGIPVFQFSRIAAYALLKKKEVSVSVDLFPEYDEESFLQMMCHRHAVMVREGTMEDFLTGTVNKKIGMAMMKKYGYKPDMCLKDISCDDIIKFLLAYRKLNIHITAVNGMENAQVCAGGVRMDEVNTKLESKKQPGLYLTGEVVDVDGKCGGYNLQWAFTSGYVAGKYAACDETGI